MSERADSALIEEAQRGNSTALGELFTRYWRLARAAAFGVTGEFTSAEDAAAEAFCEALRGIGSIRDPNRFGPWLRKIVVRKARLSLQSRYVEPDASACDVIRSSEQQDARLLRLEAESLIRNAIGSLATPLREAMALVYFEGIAPKVAADLLSVPPGTLRRRLHDGRTRVRFIVEQILQGSRSMNEERERELRRLDDLLKQGDVYQAVRGSLALRPPTRELLDALVRGRAPDAANGRAGAALSTVAQILCRPFQHASEPSHPVQAAEIAIRASASEFQDWSFDKGKPVEVFRPLLPPGFAEGRPGAFVHRTRALLRIDSSGRAHTISENLQGSPDEQTFRAKMVNVCLSEVLDLSWMTAEPMDLQSVQGRLERLTSAVLPDVAIRFSTYDEPRYRSALQFHAGGIAARAGCGGVLREWPGRLAGVEAAHVRIYLEPWAAVLSGKSSHSNLCLKRSKRIVRVDNID